MLNPETAEAIRISHEIAYWNYRILEGDNVARIIECYYDKAENIIAWVEDTAQASAWTRDELATELANMAHALGRPSITRADLPLETAGSTSRRLKRALLSGNSNLQETP